MGRWKVGGRSGYTDGEGEGEEKEEEEEEKEKEEGGGGGEDNEKSFQGKQSYSTMVDLVEFMEGKD